eukprot:161074-Amphidinium_carterae.1
MHAELPLQHESAQTNIHHRTMEHQTLIHIAVRESREALSGMVSVRPTNWSLSGKVKLLDTVVILLRVANLSHSLHGRSSAIGYRTSRTTFTCFETPPGTANRCMKLSCT